MAPVNLALASVTAPGGSATRTFGARFAEEFNVLDYGVKADGQRAIDLGCTNGSAVVTSASFTANDNGKVINAYVGTSVSTTGATTNGSRVITAIASVTGIAPLQSVVGTNIPAGAYVVAVDVNNNRVFLNRAFVASGTGTVTMTFINPVSTSIVSAGTGTATLAVAASSTVAATRAYFGTDDTMALREAITAAGTAGSGVVRLPRGTCMVTAEIDAGGTWPSNVSLIGRSRGSSIIRWASPTSMSATIGQRAVIINSGPTNYDQSVTNVTFADFTINLDAATDSPYNYNGSAIRFIYNRDVTVRNCKFTGSPATCLGMDNPQNLLVEGCVFENNARLGTGGGGSFAVLLQQNVRNPENFTFTGNKITNSGCFGVMWENFYTAATVTVSDDYAIVTNNDIYYDAYQPNSTFVWGIQASGGWGEVIANNRIKGPPINTTQFVGIGLATGDHTTFASGGSQTTHIHGNTIIGMGTPIYVLASVSNDIVISDNIVTQGGKASTGGIAVNNNADGTSRAMSGFTIRGNKCFGNAGAGIMTTASNATANTNWVIEDNHCYNNGQSGGVRAGIYFATPQTGVTIEGNVCYDDGTGLQQYGLQIAAGVAVTGAFVTGNNFSGNGVQGVKADGTITGVFRNNKGMPAPTISGNASAVTGDGDVGTYTSNVTGPCAVTITPFGSANIIADHGYIGKAFDMTTPANDQKQTAYTTTSASFSGTTVSGDIIPFDLRMW